MYFYAGFNPSSNSIWSDAYIWNSFNEVELI